MATPSSDLSSTSMNSSALRMKDVNIATLIALVITAGITAIFAVGGYYVSAALSGFDHSGWADLGYAIVGLGAGILSFFPAAFFSARWRYKKVTSYRLTAVSFAFMGTALITVLSAGFAIPFLFVVPLTIFKVIRPRWLGIGAIAVAAIVSMFYFGDQQMQSLSNQKDIRGFNAPYALIDGKTLEDPSKNKLWEIQSTDPQIWGFENKVVVRYESTDDNSNYLNIAFTDENLCHNVLDVKPGEAFTSDCQYSSTLPSGQKAYLHNYDGFVVPQEQGAWILEGNVSAPQALEILGSLQQVDVDTFIKVAKNQSSLNN